MMSKRSKAQRGAVRGFTFVEVLAAMLFMAIVIPVTFEGITLANRIGVKAARKRVAAELAAQKLNESVVTESWRSGDEAGDFEDEQPGYRWEVSAEDWTDDTMRMLTARVYYKVQEQEYSEELSTLVDSTESSDSSDSSSSSLSSGSTSSQ